MMCEDCPPIGYPTNETRCTPWSRRPKSRLFCLVPFCKRWTRSTKWSEFLCADHYRPVDRRLKRLRAMLRRRVDRLKSGADYRRDHVHLQIIRAPRSDDLVWQRIRRDALAKALP